MEGGFTVILPAYNPDGTLIRLAETLAGYGYSVLVVDDGSDDPASRSVFALLPEGVELLRHGVNMGKGAAIKTGLLHILDAGKPCGGVLTADCDGKHRPEDVRRLADRLDGGARFVIGCRSMDRLPRLNRAGNKITRAVFRARTHVKVSDTQTGLRGFSADLVPQLAEIEGRRYEYELNALLWAAEHGVTIDEVPITVDYSGRNPLSHFHVFRDSILIYSRLLKFTAVSFTAFLIDYAAVLLFSELTKGLPYLVSLFVSVVTARVISSGYAYFVNERLVFRTRMKPAALGKYFFMIGCLLAANYVLLIPVSELFGMFMLRPLIIAKPLVDGVLFICNYLLQSKIIFNQKQKEKEK